MWLWLFPCNRLFPYRTVSRFPICFFLWSDRAVLVPVLFLFLIFFAAMSLCVDGRCNAFRRRPPFFVISRLWCSLKHFFVFLPRSDDVFVCFVVVLSTTVLSMFRTVRRVFIFWWWSALVLVFGVAHCIYAIVCFCSDPMLHCCEPLTLPMPMSDPLSPLGDSICSQTR